jgi:hypothetical protein
LSKSCQKVVKKRCQKVVKFIKKFGLKRVGEEGEGGEEKKKKKEKEICSS